MRRLLALAAFALLTNCGPAEPPGEHRFCCPDGKTVTEGCPTDSCGDDFDWWPDLDETSPHPE